MNEPKRNNQTGFAALSFADLEYLLTNGSPKQAQAKPLDIQCCIHIHSKRKRIVDADGVSAKAVIDGAIHAGILRDDSPKEVKEVSYTQEKVLKEETIIYFYELQEEKGI